MSADEDNDLPSVKILLQVLNTQMVLSSERIYCYFLYLPSELPIWFFQAAWEEVEQSLVELTQTRSRVQQLQHQLQELRKEADLEVSGTTEDLHNDTLAL